MPMSRVVAWPAWERGRLTVVSVAYVAMLGLALGSFANVVVYRVPRGESVVAPPSHCPACGHGIRARHNVPVASWLVLRGRCADCRGAISARYPLVELGTCALLIVVAVRVEQIGLLPALPAYLFFAALGVVLTLIDVDSRRLPDVLVLPSYAVLLVLLAGASAWEGSWGGLARAGVGAAALFGFYFAIVLVYPAGMGFGDVKLSGLVGGVLGYVSWGTLVVGAFAGFLLGSVVGIAVIAAGSGSRKTALPFGPFMVAGAILGLLVGDCVTSWYLDVALGR